MAGEEGEGRGAGVVGGVLADRYELGSRLGRGGTAVVFDAWDRVLDRRVAVKVLDALFTSANLRRRFLMEARAAAGLAHPGLVAVLDTGEHEGLPFIVMEHVEGPTLAAVLAGRGALPAGRAARVALDLCAALAAAHAHGLVHRDVKPANVMLPPGGRARLMDFGIARALGDTVALTLTTGILGTPHYMAPEQIAAAPPDARSDLYSLGVLLYECLTGRPPFHGATAMAVAFQHVRATPVPPSRLRPDVPPSLEAVTLRALAKDPAQRWQTADQLQDALRRAAEGFTTLRPAPAPARSPGAAAPRWTGPGDDGLGLFRSPGEVWRAPSRPAPSAASPAAAAPLPAAAAPGAAAPAAAAPGAAAPALAVPGAAPAAAGAAARTVGRVLRVILAAVALGGLVLVGVVVGLRIPTGARPPDPTPVRLAAQPERTAPAAKDDLSRWWVQDPVADPAATPTPTPRPSDAGGAASEGPAAVPPPPSGPSAAPSPQSQAAADPAPDRRRLPDPADPGAPDRRAPDPGDPDPSPPGPVAPADRAGADGQGPPPGGARRPPPTWAGPDGQGHGGEADRRAPRPDSWRD